MNNAEFFIDVFWARYSNASIPATVDKGGSWKICGIQTAFYDYVAKSATPLMKLQVRLSGTNNKTLEMSAGEPSVEVSADGGSLIVKRVYNYTTNTNDTNTYTNAYLEFYETTAIGTNHGYASYTGSGESITFPNTSTLNTDFVIVVTAVLPIADQTATFDIVDGSTLYQHSVLVRPDGNKTFSDFFNYRQLNMFASIGGIGNSLEPLVSPTGGKLVNSYNISSVATPKLRKIQIVSSKDAVQQTFEALEFSGYKYQFTPPIVQGVDKSFNLKFQQNLETGITKPFQTIYPTRIGQWFQGGFFVGNISYNSKTYALIARATFGVDYKTVCSNTSITTNQNDGFANSDLLDNPTTGTLYYFARKLYHMGYADWYIPAINELQLIYNNLGPNLPTTPKQFRTGGSEAYYSANYFSSTKPGTDTIAGIDFANGTVNNAISATATNTRYIFVRRVEIV